MPEHAASARAAGVQFYCSDDVILTRGLPHVEGGGHVPPHFFERVYHWRWAEHLWIEDELGPLEVSSEDFGMWAEWNVEQSRRKAVRGVRGS